MGGKYSSVNNICKIPLECLEMIKFTYKYIRERKISSEFVNSYNILIDLMHLLVNCWTDFTLRLHYCMFCLSPDEHLSVTQCSPSV